MKNKSIAYVVRGSEDGNLGIYTTKERARKEAWAYVNAAGEEQPTILVTRKGWTPEDGFENKYVRVVANQGNVSRELQARRHVTLEGNGVECEIDGFYVNL